MNSKANTFSVSFILRKDKLKNGLAPLFMKITYNGKKVEVSLKRKIPLDKWAGAKKLLGNSPETKNYNRYLDKLYNKAYEVFEQLQLKDQPISSEIIRNKVFNLEEEVKKITLLDLSNYHNTTMKSTLEWGTLKHYYVTERYFKRFLATKHHVSDIALENIDFKFILDFENFLRNWEPKDNQKPMGNNGVMKHLIRFRKLMKLAHKLDWVNDKAFKNFKPQMDRVERECLNAEELRRIEEKELSLERIALVRDVFVFCCYTGLAYIDVYNLTEDNISLGIDGERWIHFRREKTKNPFSVPLLPQALDIIEKYKDHPRAGKDKQLLPVFSNQKTNAYLKEIADLCGIKKNLTFHLARHTFATTVTLTNGVPIESVSKMLGHTKIATTQIYAKVIESKISNDMAALKEKLSHKPPVRKAE